MRKMCLAALCVLGFLSSCTTPRPEERINPLQGMNFYRQEQQELRQMASQAPEMRQALDTIASQPAAIWLGAWTGPIRPALEKLVGEADKQGTNLVVVPYNIPYRDCGQHSAGGLPASAYKTWIDDLASGLGRHKAVVILEPDAIPLNDCLSAELKKERWELLRYALTTLKQRTGALVYMDVGHGNWVPAPLMIARLREIGIEAADGFAINTSNYQANSDNERYARQLQAAFPSKGFVFDTSRNGRGPTADQAWCNPRGRALGPKPRVLETGGPDAYLWVKRPGESDGACNGGPQAGTFWPEIAVELVKNAVEAQH